MDAHSVPEDERELRGREVKGTTGGFSVVGRPEGLVLSDDRRV
jgi:hypothetical protein